jgi:hypothetical protein
VAEIIHFPDPVLANELLEVYVWQDTPKDSYLEIGERREVILVCSYFRRTFNWNVAIDSLHEEWKNIARQDEHEYNSSTIYLFLTVWNLALIICIGDNKSHKIS